MRGKTCAGLVLLTFAISLVVLVCNTSAATPTRGGVLHYGLLSDPQNWTPHNVISCQNQVVMAQIWSALLRYDGQGKLVGDLAESWKWVDDKTGKEQGHERS